MRIVIVGLGVQGVKRQKIAGDNCVASIDPVNPAATYMTLQDVPLNSFDAVFICTPDEPKYNLIRYSLVNKKHVLVEKPLACENTEELRRLAVSNNVVFYTAYNHRFEPHFVRMRQLINSRKLGRIYHCRMFYGNGTARLVRDSAWRDAGAGVLPDLGSHLLDTMHFWFGDEVFQRSFSILSKQNFENAAPDHVIFADLHSSLTIEAEMTLLSWRNHFTCDIFAEHGSAHIRSLCKWGPSTFTHRSRILPSGRPTETSDTIVQPDPTWQLEYEHFLGLCADGSDNCALEVDSWIHGELERMGKEELLIA